jgi:lysophospholipase
MAYTASILSFILEGLSKPVIVTGSQIPIIEMRNDALSNLLGALTIAGHYNIPEVTLYFDNRLLRGNRASKLANSDLDAFESPNLDPLATVGIEITVHWDKIERAPNEPFRVFDSLEDKIAYIRFHPLINAETIMFTGEAPQRAMIIGTYGAGNIPDNRPDILDALRSLHSAGVVLVNVT